MSENIWTCECGQAGNSGKFCINCGKKRPEEKPLEAEPIAEAAAVAAAAPVAAVSAPVVEASPVQPVAANVPAYNPAPYQQPYNSYAQPNQNKGYVAAAANEPKKTSPASLILGIFSIVCLFVQPLGAILAIIGLITSRKGGTAGKVLCILGLVFGVIFLLLDLLLASIIMTAK